MLQEKSVKLDISFPFMLPLVYRSGFIKTLYISPVDLGNLKEIRTSYYTLRNVHLLLSCLPIKRLLVRVVAYQSGKEEGRSVLVPKLFPKDPSRPL